MRVLRLYLFSLASKGKPWWKAKEEALPVFSVSAKQGAEQTKNSSFLLHVPSLGKRLCDGFSIPRGSYNSKVDYLGNNRFPHPRGSHRQKHREKQNATCIALCWLVQMDAMTVFSDCQKEKWKTSHCGIRNGTKKKKSQNFLSFNFVICLSWGVLNLFLIYLY